MKLLLLLLLSFLAVACEKSGKKPSVTSQTTTSKGGITNDNIFSITEVDKQRFNQAKKRSKRVPDIDTTLIRKTNGKIELPIEVKQGGNSSLIFNDRINPDNEEENITYVYKGYYKSINNHLLVTSDYESIEYELISKSGLKTSVWSEPLFSNDGKYFACIMSYRLEGEPVGLQIWEIDQTESFEQNQLKLILELNQLMFNPLEYQWDHEGALLIRAEKMKDNFYPKEPSEEYYLKLEYK